MNDTWGKKKQNFYKNQSSDDNESDDDEDQEIEAARLQKIRDAKRKRFEDKHDDQEDEREAQPGQVGAVSDSSDDDESDDDGQKLGDKLFDSDEETKKARDDSKQSQLNMMDATLVKQIIESDSPELLGLLDEF